jgi:hypothetical protein
MGRRKKNAIILQRGSNQKTGLNTHVGLDVMECDDRAGRRENQEDTLGDITLSEVFFKDAPFYQKIGEIPTAHVLSKIEGR